MLSSARRRILGLGALGLGTEAVACPYPALGEALIAVQILAVAVIAIVFTIVLRGSDDTTERLFPYTRVIRWPGT